MRAQQGVYGDIGPTTKDARLGDVTTISGL
jgi:hypothetical protein